jgi:hypothetical protein
VPERRGAPLARKLSNLKKDTGWKPCIIHQATLQCHLQLMCLFIAHVSNCRRLYSAFPAGSAPGPSGWTFEHIQAVAQGSSQGMDPVLDLANAILSGSLTAWQALRASRLIPLCKGVDGVRPIAVGEVWRQLVAQCVGLPSPVCVYIRYIYTYGIYTPYMTKKPLFGRIHT